ncbi:pur operon repressor [Paenibacillus sp. MMS20-IR301]|uniref:pur operon repressor n=1 Tax=Paenibacillus sp. MMS20-IR301 TaxID=2895946 RepID=UPI0028E8E72F|nr:pur operon repressor [Paenibacillus sp. MMS20-IR301]WNS42201.1 pur operon repressor [Paenibacillus sp. MMS20-IR301]
MKKLKRSQRLVDMTQFLLEKPHDLLPLSTFAERYGAAKSSVSEDLAIIKEVFEGEGMGELQTLAGAAGGVRYIPRMPTDMALAFVNRLCGQLEQSDRILPGGYLYMSDLLGLPSLMEQAGKIIATAFYGVEIDAVMTVETKGIPLAYATAAQLGLPVVLVRRDHQVTEGSAVSINYVSGSHKSIHTMSLSRRALREKSRVLIVDDFMKAGGTVRGMVDLLGEFNAEVAGVGVLVESGAVEKEERLLHDYVSLVKLTEVDSKVRRISAHPGNYFSS